MRQTPNLRQIGRSARKRIRRVRQGDRPGLNDLDRKLEPYLNFRNGFFIEAGANDGYEQSNTYFLERRLAWTGLLVEGIPERAASCARQRPASTVVNCALVSDDFEGDSITMHFADLMSVVDGARNNPELEQAHVEEGLSVQRLDRSYDVTVPTRTLASILEDLGSPPIDFLSLDVEGYELNVLRGLRLDTHRPRYMLIEERTHHELGAFVESHQYEMVGQLTYHDFLYRDRTT